jgi:hypothetical protein
MSNISTIKIIESIPEITDEIRSRCFQKEYFKNLNLPTSSFIEFLVNDYLQCLHIYMFSGSIETFKDKVVWFKFMAKNKIPLRDSELDLLDFTEELKKVTLYFNDDCYNKIEQAFNDFNGVIKSIYKEVE